MLRKFLRSFYAWLKVEPLPKFAECGENASICRPLVAGYPERIHIGNNVHIGPGAVLVGRGGLYIEDGVIIGPRLHVYTVGHNYMDAEVVPYDGKVLLKPVTICMNVWIGGDVIVAPGVRIGEGAVVGVGAVVVRDVPALAVVGGNPAKILKYRDRYKYERIKGEGNNYLKLKAEGAIEIEEVLEER